ncbi:M23 family metallopeptidase [Neisseria sp. Dent CA1/247]|uniref:M23 family metallopeptidase n=1 Tax=Neisseria sp. Dent CA1/247 TaxID=2912675 RepID=UPI001FD2AF50|nr:M23 family metallopeptidase [Neisseria sp. Dent CA1/247]UOO76584.1 M23 family metallopeptidase [Neisseria sp. Dent CA1/247]
MKTQLTYLLKKILPAATALVLAACATTSSDGPVPEGHYRVQSGDTLYRISQRFGQSVQTLAAWNNLKDPTKIEVGQVLKVRAQGRLQESPRKTQTVAPTNRLTLQWPVSNGSANIIEHYNGSTNKGIDIAGELGMPVRAAAAGKVLYAGEDVRGYGKMVLISHNSSTITAYAHNDSFTVQKGQTVQAGQTIATMGSTDTDRVKLHFEVRINGKAVNPTQYLR